MDLSDISAWRSETEQERNLIKLRDMFADLEVRMVAVESALKRVTAVLREVPKPAGLNVKLEEKR